MSESQERQFPLLHAAPLSATLFSSTANFSAPLTTPSRPDANFCYNTFSPGIRMFQYDFKKFQVKKYLYNSIIHLYRVGHK